MTTLIIGSTAARRWWSDFPRQPKDLDVFSNKIDLHEDGFWDDRIHCWLLSTSEGMEQRLATPDELYTIKLSHTEWELKNGSWNKHMSDLLWMQERGCRVDEDLYTLLRSVWVDRYGDRRFNLSDDKATFFSDGVKRRYDHDSLHRSVAVSPALGPCYEAVLKDGAEVDMDMKKVWSAEKQFVLDLFYEEIAVTALERKVIPSGYTCSPSMAWAWALRRTVTSLTKGKSSRFIRENYNYYRTPPHDYVAAHKLGSNYLEELA